MARILLLSLLVASASAQPVTPDSAGASREGALTVRVSGGLTSLSLGDAGAFHEAMADAYRASGVPVPTQRPFSAGPAGGVEVLWRTQTTAGTTSNFGVGVHRTEASAYSLYGDYAGTLDLVSNVSVVFVQSVSTIEFARGRAVRPYLGSRGGTVLATARNDEVLDLGTIGAGRSEVTGRGSGYSLEGIGGLTAWAGPVGLFVEGGYRYARVKTLNGDVRIDGESRGEGALPYGLNLSGWMGSAGLTVRPRF